MRGGGDPPSPNGFGGQGLTARVRALYERSALPVAEIARLCGVSERTIYKYAARHNWQPRYAWAADGSRPRGRRRRPAPARGAGWQAHAKFAPVKGAGARFIRRAEQGKPFAAGLKATDPAAAARAAADCAQADALSRAAQEEAAAERRFQEREDAFAAVSRSLERIADYREAYEQKRKRPPPEDDPLLRAMAAAFDAQANRLEALRREEAEVKAQNAPLIPAQAGIQRPE